MLNNVTLVGRLVRGAELRYAKSGTAVCKFTLAVTAQSKKLTSSTAFAGRVRLRINYTGGSLVAVQGSIQTGSYEDKGRTKAQDMGN